jgi:hypothetical protein
MSTDFASAAADSWHPTYAEMGSVLLSERNASLKSYSRNSDNIITL